MQGYFSHWFDGYPIQNIDWITLNDTKKWPTRVSLHSLNNNSYYAEDETQKIMSIIKLLDIYIQPEVDFTKNCTAVLNFDGCRPRGWVAISCHQKYYVNLICVADSKYKDDTIYSNETELSIQQSFCSKPWLLIGEKCLKISQVNSMSFTEANSTCHNNGDILLSVTKIPSPKTIQTNLLGLEDEINVLQGPDAIPILGVRVPESTSNSKPILGIPFVYDSPHKELSHIFPLLEMLPSIAKRKPLVLPFIETLSDHCWILELGVWQMIQAGKTQGPQEKQKYWAIKPRVCDIEVQPTVFVCQRKPQTQNMTCLSTHFTCDDHTCILSVYICDNVSDCSNGEDERECPEHTHITSVMDVGTLYSPAVPCKTIFDYSRKEEMIGYVKEHSLCDGVHECNIINEKVCKYNNVSAMSDSHKSLFITRQPFTEFFQSDVARDAFITRVHYNIIQTNDQIAKSNLSFKSLDKLKKFEDLQRQALLVFFSFFERPNTTELSHMHLNCPRNKLSYAIYDYCVINDNYPCGYGSYDEVCNHIQCAGMFKCKASVCIRLSSMCDEHIDCPLAEDENNCSNISCPGLLKCRNENRCIGWEQICDGSRDCIYSSDDEIFCNECSAGCKCTGYGIKCSDIQETIYTFNSTTDAKSLTLRGNITTLSLKLNYPTNLVYIDVSFCKIHAILSNKLKRKNVTWTTIFVANFSGNALKNDFFLVSKQFSHLVILDLSRNFFAMIVNNSFAHLKRLKILKFDQNPIININIFLNIHLRNLWILGVTKLNYNNIKVHYKGFAFGSSLRIITDNGLLCCYFSNDIRCIVKDSETCYWFIKNKYDIAVITILTLFAITTSVGQTSKHSISLVKKYRLKTMLTTHVHAGISEIFTSTYLCFILAARYQEVNIMYWQTGITCRILQGLISISLATNIMLKAAASLVLLVKTMYPFEHQCRWINYTWLLCGVIWFLFICICTLFISYTDTSFAHNPFCTYWCQGTDQLIYIKSFVALIHLTSVICLIVSISLIQIQIRKSESLHRLLNTTIKHYHSVKIILPLAIEITTEALFHSLGILLFIYEVDLFCMIIICYLLPCKIIISTSKAYVIFIFTKVLA